MNGEQLPNNLHRLLKLIMVTRGIDLAGATEFLSTLAITLKCSDSLGHDHSDAAQVAAMRAVDGGQQRGLQGDTPADGVGTFQRDGEGTQEFGRTG